MIKVLQLQTLSLLTVILSIFDFHDYFGSSVVGSTYQDLSANIYIQEIEYSDKKCRPDFIFQHFCLLLCASGDLHFHVNIPSITFDIIFSTYSRHIPYRLYSYQTFQRYVYSVSIHFHYCSNSQCTKVEKIALITWPVRGVLRGRRVFTPYKNLSYCDCYTIRIYKILVMGCSSNPKVIDWLNFAKLHYFKICGQH